MANCLFKRLYKGVLSECLNLITKDFDFFISIINQYLNCKFINEENKFKLIKLKKIIIDTEKRRFNNHNHNETHNENI